MLKIFAPQESRPKYTKFGEWVTIGQTPNHAKLSQSDKKCQRHPLLKICAPEKSWPKFTKIGDDWLIELKFYVPLHTKEVISETFTSQSLWLVWKTKPNTTKIHSQEQNKCTTTQNKTNKSSAVAEMGDHLATIDMSPAVPLSVGGELGP